MKAADRVILFVLQIATPGLVVLALATTGDSAGGERVTVHEWLDALVGSVAVSAAAFRLIWPLPKNPDVPDPGTKFG